MCGISGIVSPPFEGLHNAIAGMVSIMHHRGPDGNGTYIDVVDGKTSVALGHNRLSILDLSDQAAQPMRSRDGRYVLAYNGEVYNYKEIAAELTREELPDERPGDTAVVLAALIKWGPRALAMFNGMWAILLYDAKEKTLLVSRDRFGVKPLYYFRRGNFLYFASEVKAILKATGEKFPVNPDTAIPYLTRGLLNFSENSFFSGISQFPTASYQVIDLCNLDSFENGAERFWKHPYELSVEQVPGVVSPNEIRDLFLDAVRLRLRSDVPVGMLLSGGVDSSAILGGITYLDTGSDITILSVTSDDPKVSEERYIDRMADFVKLSPQKVNVSKESLGLLDSLPEAVWYNDEPICGIADIAYLRLMEIAKSRGIKVLLSGQGADEQLGGYNKFFYFWLICLARQRRYLDFARLLLASARNSNTLFEFRLSEAIRYMGKQGVSAGTFIAPRYQGRDTLDIGLQKSYAQREWMDIMVTSVPQLLHYEDRMSMSQSIEVRVPFLDYRIVELLARVHPSEKFAGGWTKSIFRKAIHGLVPPQIQYRRDKKGFAVPEDYWMKVEFKPRMQELLRSEMAAHALGFLDQGELRRMYEKFTAGQGILNGRHFSRVLIFETFLRRFASYISQTG